MSLPVHRIIADEATDAPSISALDRGFQLGDGVFDTAVAFDGRIFALERHLQRLLRHAETIGIEADGDLVRGTIAEILAEVDGRHAIIRTTLSRGQAARGLWPGSPSRPSLLVTAQAWTPSLVGQPARLCLAAIPRNQHSPLTRIKSLAYLENILAARQAAGEDADDALIRNLDGNAVCTTIANVFAVVDGALVTPPLKDGCLDGVVRGLIIEEARLLGLRCVEQSLTPDLLDRADSLFLTNSVRLIRPVHALAERSLRGSPLAGRLLACLLARIESETSVRLQASLDMIA